MQKAEEKASQEEAETLIESLETVSDITHNEASKILQQHKQRMDEHQGNRRVSIIFWWEEREGRQTCQLLHFECSLLRSVESYYSEAKITTLSQKNQGCFDERDALTLWQFIAGDIIHSNGTENKIYWMKNTITHS